MGMAIWEGRGITRIVLRRDCVCLGRRPLAGPTDRHVDCNKRGKLLLSLRMYGSRVPSVRACPNCGMLINHTGGCKHITCEGCGHTKLRHQTVVRWTILKLLSGHERCRKVEDQQMTIRRHRQKRSLESIFQPEIKRCLRQPFFVDTACSCSSADSGDRRH